MFFLLLLCLYVWFGLVLFCLFVCSFVPFSGICMWVKTNSRSISFLAVLLVSMDFLLVLHWFSTFFMLNLEGSRQVWRPAPLPRASSLASLGGGAKCCQLAVGHATYLATRFVLWLGLQEFELVFNGDTGLIKGPPPLQGHKVLEIPQI